MTTSAQKHIAIALLLLDAAAPPPVEFEEPKVSGEAAFKMFMNAARMIWKSDLLDQLNFSYTVAPNKANTFATLSVTLEADELRKKRAFGDSLVRIPKSKEFRLRIHPKLLEMSVEAVRKTMIHEAVHIGHDKHDSTFDRVVRKYHGAPDEQGVLEQDHKLVVFVEAQPAKGKRFTRVKDFDFDKDVPKTKHLAKEAAMAFAKQLIEQGKAYSARVGTGI